MYAVTDEIKTGTAWLKWPFNSKIIKAGDTVLVTLDINADAPTTEYRPRYFIILVRPKEFNILIRIWQYN